MFEKFNADGAGLDDRVQKYALLQLAEELYNLEKSFNEDPYQIDPYTKAAYRRCLELVWSTKSLFYILKRLLPFPLGSEIAGSKTPISEAGLKRVVLSSEQPKRTLPFAGKLFFDITDAINVDAMTGIQRVVWRLCESLSAYDGFFPSVIRDGALFVLEGNSLREASVSGGDVFLTFDACWNHRKSYDGIGAWLRANDVRCVVGVHDILPIRYKWLFPPELSARFSRWFYEFASNSDGLITFSATTACAVRDVLKALHRSVPVYPCLPGSDMMSLRFESGNNRWSWLKGDSPYFLSVGTVEPRKGYPISLRAFNDIWREGIDVKYVIVGKQGWGMNDFSKKIMEHELYNKNLVWITDATDHELAFLYGNARATIISSFAEGFGLPVVEAAHYKCPIIASDIPLFREIAGKGVTFFDLLDADDLKCRLLDSLASRREFPSIRNRSWADCSEDLLKVLSGIVTSVAA